MRGGKHIYIEHAFNEDGFQEAVVSVCAVNGGGGALHVYKPCEYRVGNYMEVLYAAGLLKVGDSVEACCTYADVCVCVC
jgi:hypothetical protein